MNLYSNQFYLQDIQAIANLDLPWEILRNRNILISGATGLIGSFLIDVVMEKNKTGLNCSIYALSRNTQKAKERFSEYKNNTNIYFITHDINKPLILSDIKTIDFIMHLASNTHPMQYSTDPIGTITTNILGVYNMLNFAAEHHAARFAFASSNEIYGENRGDVELFDENYCGYINCNTMRAGYPESKRCGEALCQSYKAQKGLDIVIPRLTRSYGPTMLMSDTKAISQFIKKGIAGEDIILKSAGNQFYSYTYVADAVSGLLTILLKGENGEAYNIADEKSDITLRNLASLIAEICKVDVVFDIPDAIEAAGYSTATKARLKSDKLHELGWVSLFDIKTGISRTIKTLKNNF